MLCEAALSCSLGSHPVPLKMVIVSCAESQSKPLDILAKGLHKPLGIEQQLLVLVDVPLHHLPKHVPAPFDVPDALAPRQHHLARVEAQQHHRRLLAAVDEPGKHVLLVRAFHGHALVHLLDVEKLPWPKRNFRVGHNVLHVAVDDVVPRLSKEGADEACHAKGGQEAFVPAQQQLLDAVRRCCREASAQQHITSF